MLSFENIKTPIVNYYTTEKFILMEKYTYLYTDR